MIAQARARTRGDARLLRIDPCGDRFSDARIAELPALLRPGDLLVVNDAATLPASFRAVLEASPAAAIPVEVAVEVRLASPPVGGQARAVLFGAGDWRTPTERRPAPPAVARGAHLRFVGGGPDAPVLRAVVGSVSELSPRLVELRFEPDGDGLAELLFAYGRPVQYSHVEAPLELWDVQTAYASRPWAVEAPSAGLSLPAATLLALRARGVRLAALTHAAGLSATGDPALDAALPLAESYDLPAETVAAIGETRASGNRVVAVGTTVVRALEGALVERGRLHAGRGTTSLHIRPGFRTRVVHGLLTGLHEPGSSHLDLLSAFVARPLLDEAYAHAAEAGYSGHELGDTSLILCD